MHRLRARRRPPLLDGWSLQLPGEPSCDVDPADHDPGVRETWLRATETSAVLAHSSPLGIEDLPRAEGQPLLDAYHDGVASLCATDRPESRLGWWAALSSDSAHAGDVSAQRELTTLLERGAASLQVPATWFSGPEEVRSLQPLLATLQETGRPLFIHPGRAHPGPARLQAGEQRPVWWAPVVDYTAQMAAAWWSWHAAARPGLPTLRVCFAAGAGLAPVHHERLRARGGSTLTVDPLTYVELSGYGLQAFDALLRVLGIDGLISASDHPYGVALDLPTDLAAHRAIRHTNPHRLMTGGMP